MCSMHEYKKNCKQYDYENFKMARQVLYFSAIQVLCINSLITLATGSRFCVWNSIQINSTTRSCANSVHCSTELYFQDISTITSKYSEVEAYLCSVDYKFDDPPRVIRFVNISSVAINGASPSSEIDCDNSKSGIFFKNVRMVTLSNITLIQCSFQIKEHTIPFISAISITNSSVITITNIRIHGSQGFGLSLVNNNGHIKITSSTFDENHDLEYKHIGGGILIDSSTSQEVAYHIENCNFTRNGASLDASGNFEQSNITEFERGGGINAHFRAETSHINMSITDCLFESNIAKCGGALYLSFQDSAHNVAVTVSESAFHDNHAVKCGGGVAAGYVQTTDKMTHNLVFFKSCNFTNNCGKKGGAMYLYAAPKQNGEQNYNNFKFDNCTWTENKGTYGSAVLISRYASTRFFKDGDLPVLLFKSCSFKRNNNQKILELAKNANISRYGRGTLYVNQFPVAFSGKMTFTENKNNSAIYLFSSILEITAGSYTLLERNVGYQGGAINLRGFSSIYVNDNVTMKFDSNLAWDRGGAIFHATLIDPSHLTEINCFIKYAGQRDKDRNVRLHFINNTIISHGLHQVTKPHRGQSIFLSSAIPCSRIHGVVDYMVEKALNSTATFIFEGGIKNDTIATYPSYFISNLESSPEFIIPGKEIDLKVFATDDTQNLISLPTYRIESDPEMSNNITINPAYTITKNNIVKLHGPPKSKGRVLVMILEQEDVALSFDVILDECPPGFIYSNWTSSCECSTNTQTLYLGVKRCNLTAYHAYLIPGYWAGYVSDYPSEGSFRTSNCPLGYCTNKFNESEVPLPPKASSDDINAVVCATNRRGVMCSECNNHTSAHYHTQWTYDCGPEEKCHLGILLFIASQILPITVLFLVVILLDIQLNTGALNGFLFFMQVISTLHITANDIIKIPTVTNRFLIVLNSIVKAFNLNFFVLPGLHFCLFKGANTLDLLAFDYVFVVYSLLLVLFTVMCLNRRCTRHVNRLQGRKILRTSSIIHGLSGFLVLCYAKTTTVTLKILTPGWVREKGIHHHEIVVFYYGSISFFHKQHLKYAVPALFVFIFMTSLPPLLLLIYPLCYRILALFRVEESKFTKILCTVIPLEKFKPLFDSFQGEFRDNYRCFAGLYFVYRFFILLLFVISSDLIAFYCYLSLLLIIMCVLHGWFQPYKKTWHNRLDLSLFALLAVINGITLYNYTTTVSQRNDKQAIAILSTLQVLLAYSPLIFMILYLLKKIHIKKLINFLIRKLKKRKDDNSSALSLSMLDEGREDQASYQKFE